MKTGAKTKTYSTAIAFFALLFSLKSWYILFNTGTLIWIPVGLLLMLIYYILVNNISIFRKHIDQLLLPPIFYKILLIIISCCFFSTSLHGLIHLINTLDINDPALKFMPIFISIFLFGGVSLGIIQEDRLK